MSSISRQLPYSEETRWDALKTATEFKEIPTNNNFLTDPTNDRLDNMHGGFKDARTDRATAGGAASEARPLKDLAKEKCKQICSHFVQVFNLGVDRGKYPAGHRDHYHLPIGSGAVPEMNTEEQIKKVAQDIVAGDVTRLAAGGVAMANPTAAEVNTLLVDYVAKLDAQRLLDIALDQKEEALAGLFPEADKVIKKVWDEVETYYNEEDPESMRDNARDWGVIYITVGEKSTLNIVATIAGGGAPVAIQALLKQTGLKGNTNAQGQVTLETTLVGNALLILTRDGLQKVELPITIEEGSTQNVAVEMVAV